jgi:hypothetical protein
MGMGNDIDESVSRHRVKIEELQHDLWRRPEHKKRISADIEKLRIMIRQTFGRAGKLLNNCKLVNSAGTIVGCVVSAKDGFYVYRRTRLFRKTFDFVDLGRLFSADEIKTLAARLAEDQSTYIRAEDWPRITRGLGRRQKIGDTNGRTMRGNKGVSANVLVWPKN